MTVSNRDDDASWDPPNLYLTGSADQTAEWWALLEAWRDEGAMPPVHLRDDDDTDEGETLEQRLARCDGLMLWVYAGKTARAWFAAAPAQPYPLVLLGSRADEAEMARWVGGPALDYLVLDRVSALRFRTSLRLAWRRYQTQLQRDHWQHELRHYWETFARITAHDLREPLRALHNYSSFLEEDIAEWVTPENRDYLKAIRRLSRRMDRMLADLHRLTRLASGPLVCREFDAMPLIIGVMQRLAPQIKAGGTEIRVVMPLPQIFGDEHKLTEVFHRLVTNAIEHNPNPHPYIEVGSVEDPAGIVLYVRDNGEGISADISDQVFDLFRGRSKHRRDEDGSGAGLTIADQLVRQHGGTIWFESEVGGGTTFYVRLPGGCGPQAPERD